MAPGASARQQRERLGQAIEQRCQKYVTYALNKLERGEVAQGYRRATVADGLAGESALKPEQRKTLKEQTRKALTECNKAATAQLEEANHQYRDGQFDEALRTYRVVATMTKLSSSKRANEKLEMAKYDPRVTAALTEVDAAGHYDRVTTLLALGDPDVDRCFNCGSPACEGAFVKELESTTAQAGDEQIAPEPASDVAETQPAYAAPEDETAELARELALVRHMDPDERLKLVSTLEMITTTYPDTPTGQKSARFLDALMADEPFAAALQRLQNEKELGDLFEQAQLYQRSGMSSQAAELFQQIIETSPDSELAAKARAILENHE